MRNSPLKIMVEEKRYNLLRHPVTLGLLRYKYLYVRPVELMKKSKSKKKKKYIMYIMLSRPLIIFQNLPLLSVILFQTQMARFW